MRKRTLAAIGAFLTECPFREANTEVSHENVDTAQERVCMYLHGNRIAWYYTREGLDSLHVSACGWFTPTTKDRLNAIPGVGVCQKDWDWFLNGRAWNGQEVRVSDWNSAD